ncbi:MAG: suppressor of fused domain protein [Myxococcales bacterium]
MGFFDRFRRSPAANSPPAPAAASEPASAEPPQVPFPAKITSFVPTDGLGTLAAENQAPIKFGKSGCRGFEPAVGLAVEVVAVSPSPLGGWKATEVKLKSDAATYDALLAKRDAALGIERKPLNPVEEAAAASQVLGWVIVLLAEAPPRRPGAFSEWAQRMGLEAAGIRVNTEGGFHLGIGRHDAIAYIGEGPFPRNRLAQLGAPESFQPGQGFIGLSLGIPGQVPLFRVTGNAFDPWSADGPLRDLSKIALELSKHGCAVVLPQAGTLVGADTFRTRLGDLDDPNCRPFGAWIGFSVDCRYGIYSTYGMVLQAQPNVSVEVDVDDPWELDRAREALLVACSRMVHSNEPLKPGERLEVPVGQPVGAAPMALVEGDAETYLVEDKVIDQAAAIAVQAETGASLSSGLLHLQRISKGGVRAKWAESPQGRQPRIALNTYKELLRSALADSLDAHQFTGLTPRLEGDYPPFEIDVWEARTGRGYFMSSNGVGRVAQAFGESANGTDHVELVAAMQAHHPLIANTLARVAAQVHLQQAPGDIFKPGDTIGIAVPEVGAAGFVLANAGSIRIAQGPMIHLLELVPLAEGEYVEARQRGSSGLRERIGKMSPESRAARWKLRLS